MQNKELNQKDFTNFLKFFKFTIFSKNTNLPLNLEAKIFYFLISDHSTSY